MANFKNHKERNNTKTFSDKKPAEKVFSRSRCPYAKKCGGFSEINTPMEEQLKTKQAYVEECIGAYGKVDPIIRMKNPDRYRNKVTSIFGLDRKGKPVCGVYKAHTHEIVPVKDCLIEDKRADAVIQTIYGMLQSFKIRVYNEDADDGLLKAVQVRVAHETRQMMVTPSTTGPISPPTNKCVTGLTKTPPDTPTIVHNINEKHTTMILGDREKVLYGKGYIEDVLCGKKFRLSSRSFYQINSIQTEKLYRIALDCAGLSGKETVLDAYCGIGTIGICASDLAKEVVSVELNPEGAKDAQTNIELNGIKNVSVFNDDAGEFLKRLAAADAANAGLELTEEGRDMPNLPDVVIMDPPRSGSSEEFLDTLGMIMPKKIVYVSCNPETLGRDLEILTEDYGYVMKKAVPVDMFPYTEGCEVVVRLDRK